MILSGESRVRLKLGIALVLVGSIVLWARLAYLQLVRGDYYLKLTSVTHISKERVVPIRGIIKDRYGEPLAIDIPVYNLYMIPRFIRDQKQELNLLEELGILSASDVDRVLSRLKKIKGLNRFNSFLVKKGLVSAHCPFDGTMLVKDQHGMLKCPVCGRRFQDQVARFYAHAHELQGLFIRTSLKRYYPKGGLTVHPVGYVNEVGPADIARHPDLYVRGDLIGRAGIEKAFDRKLRGKPGIKVFVRTAGGRRIDPSTLPPPFNKYKDVPAQPGDNITLTIDWDLTRAAARAMKWRYSGAVVVLDVHTGEVLVMYSKPTFNPNLGSFGWKRSKDYDPGWFSPMLNKAVMAYPPGSTFKMVTAVAALSEGVIEPDTKLHCGGAYYYRGHKFGCHARYGHGEVDILRALEVSCDVYFYQVAQMLGMDMIAHYARDYFGMGQHTGIEIPEHIGLIPTVRWHERHSPGGYVPGFDLNTSVGQGAVKVTPLQLARAYAALVNGGKLLKVALVKEITSAQGQVLYVHKPYVERLLGLSPQVVQTVEEGLYLVVNGKEGTARRSAIRDIPFAGKTGTAQAPEWRPNFPKRLKPWLKQDHAWFVGYAPAQDPQVVVVAFVEHGGGGGKGAAPVVKKVIEAYYRLYQKSIH